MKNFWLIFISAAIGMILAGAVVGAVFWWWLGCDGWSFC